MEVLPLANAQVVEELGAAQAAERRAGQLALPLAEVIPERHEGQEVGLGLREAPVRGVGGLLVVCGALARVLDGQRGGDDEDLAGAALVARLDDHPGDARVDGEAGHLAAGLGEAVILDGVQFFEELDAVGDRARVRRVDEGELADVAEPGGGHLEDDAGQVRALDLGVGELGPALEVLFGVEPYADAVGDAAAAALALVGARLRDRLDGEALHLGAQAVPADAGGARVDHVTDAGDGERGFRDVGGEDDAAARHGAVRRDLEHPVLLGGRQPGVQRQHVGVRPAAQRVGGVADLLLPGQEHEDVAWSLALELADRVGDGGDLVAVLVGRPAPGR